ncbi:MAG: Rossman fold protein, TIGR00730 family [Candidatus Brennerbacteria bacterium RIFOXYB1_FULL_41_13]|uniref:Cytokinin riboside 5'-monophosphate phosphoribohydrolase n=1 Tax=Candidatus Brennerbacteria bacterium RIFOXYD1_FULL_41_16 TaxID=1797529 RepID=A0A1G1XKV9_9BACT|nr:MAG: Rossman fold protein, TIGR00730 family [Candidatus Brennerbacteria bacterium RIFOXYB1_FULL_41_13]OGY40592.1 MAG: Rossman fold protein, TIGR00730 family [Candidatus Brennerbacteria bacterium RIFOXYD1_FULL_41_16]
MKNNNQPDFRQTILWRIFRIMAEFVDGFGKIVDFPKSVSIFGSTRSRENNHWYQEARKLGAMLGKDGFAVVTGGASGIMEAGNRGAFEAGADSVGLNIQLPHEQESNKYLTDSLNFHYFFTRKVMLTYAAEAYVYFPGGFGTLDEFYELITLIQTKKIRKVPIVIVGKDFWQPLLDYMRNVVSEKYKNIDEDDMEIYQLVDTAEEAFRIIQKSVKELQKNGRMDFNEPTKNN